MQKPVKTEEAADTVPGPPSERATLKRRAFRACYDRETIFAILDEGLVAHVAFLHQGTPRVLPTIYARIGDFLYFHGSTANRMLRSLCAHEGCVTVDLIDGLVLARSAFSHSVNFRSAVLFGQATAVTDREEKARALERTVEHAVPGRWPEIRPPSEQEFLRTLVVRFPIDEASAKIKAAHPVDDPEDHARDCWAGVIPLSLHAGTPEPDPELRPGIAVPQYAQRYGRG